ncbi:DUF2490 domain-containing protein [Methylophilus sp. 5]|uniref:DUF2490 domain-containing protein n=1 Tax=Methylophilus sp. 5 TaxID=1112274 RepID=UPI0018DEE62D|nr:DUF2490 domain-containing protein [Methylophilus sp. 5]
MTNRNLHPYCYLCILILGVSAQAWAGPEEDGSYWHTLRLQGTLPAQNLYWNMDFNPRYRNEGKHIDYLYYRPAIFYKPNPKTSLWLGHDTIIGHPAGKSAYHENRWWEQFQYQFDPIASITFTNRTRVEEREREGFHDVGYRLREMIKSSTPLKNHSKLSFVVSNELFINVDKTDWGARRGFDQNRFFVGLNWKITERCNLETGYLNQFVNKATHHLENHIINTTLGFKF